MDHFGVFVHHMVFDMYIFTDGGSRKDDAVFDHGTLFDHTATSDNGILNGSLDETAVRHNRIFHICGIKILCRTGIVGPGINGPFIIKKILSGLKVDQRDICVIVTLEISNGSKISSV